MTLIQTKSTKDPIIANYKPIITNSAFNNNYIRYESKGDKGKSLSIEKYLNMIKPYLNDIINDY